MKGVSLRSILGTVLIIEDDADARRLLKKALILENFEVLEACDGIDALLLLQKVACPDLILLDLSMPRMGGAEFIRQLRAIEKFSQVKVAIVSGWDDLAALARDAGADGYIRKPVGLGDLQRQVTQLIQSNDTSPS